MRNITNEKTKTKNLGEPYSNTMPTWRDTANWLPVLRLKIVA